VGTGSEKILKETEKLLWSETLYCSMKRYELFEDGYAAKRIIKNLLG